MFSNSTPRSNKRRRTEVPLLPALPEMPEMPEMPSLESTGDQSMNQSFDHLPPFPSQPVNQSIAFSSTDYNDSAAAEMNSVLESMSNQSTNQSKQSDNSHRKGRRVGHTLTKLPADLERKMGEANTAFIAEDFDRAAKILLAIINQSPTSVSPYHTLCLIYEAQNDKAKVLDTLLLLSQLETKDSITWSRIAQLSFEMDKLDQALDAASKAIKLNSDDQVCQEIRALIWIEQKDWVKAAGAVGSLMQAGNKSPLLNYYMAQCYYYTGQYDQALVILEEYYNNWKAKQAIKQSINPSQKPKPRSVNFLLEFDEMEDEVDQQANKTPEADLNAFELLADLYERSHRYDCIMKMIDAIHVDHPFHALPLSMQAHYAISLIHNGQFQRAALLLNTLWDSESDEAPAFIFKVAQAYTDTGHLQNSFNSYSLIEHIEPYKSMPELWLRQAACLRALGTTEKEAEDCLALYERVARVDPGNAEARIGRIDLCRELGLHPPHEIEHDTGSLYGTQTKRRRGSRKTDVEVDSAAQAKAMMHAVAKAMGDVARAGNSVWKSTGEERVVLDESVFECGFFETKGQLSLLLDHCNTLLRENKRDEYYALLFPIVDTTLNVASGYTNMLPEGHTLDGDDLRRLRIAVMTTLLTVESFEMIGNLLSAMYENGEYRAGVEIVSRLDSIVRRRYDFPALCWRLIHVRLRILGVRLALRAYRQSTANDETGEMSFLTQACMWLRKCYVQEAHSRDPTFVLLAASVLQLTSYRGRILRHESHRHPDLLVDTLMGYQSGNGHYWTRAAGRFQRAMSLLSGCENWESNPSSLRLYSILALQVAIMLMQRSQLRSKRRNKAAQPKSVDSAHATQFIHLFMLYHAKVEASVHCHFAGEIDYQFARAMAPTAIKYRTLRHLEQAAYRVEETQRKSAITINHTLNQSINRSIYKHVLFYESDALDDEIIQAKTKISSKKQSKSTNNQSINQSNKSISDTDTIEQSTNQSINQSINQSVSQSINQPMIRIEPEWLIELRDLSDRARRIRAAIRQVSSARVSRSVQRRRDLARAANKLREEDEE